MACKLIHIKGSLYGVVHRRSARWMMEGHYSNTLHPDLLVNVSQRRPLRELTAIAIIYVRNGY